MGSRLRIRDLTPGRSLIAPKKNIALQCVATFRLGSVQHVSVAELIELGRGFPPKTKSSAFADSQIRFFGGVLAGVGGLLWWSSNDAYERQIPLAIIAVGFLAGVLGRVLAGRKHGFGPNMKLYMWAEAVGVALVYGVGKLVGEW